MKEQLPYGWVETSLGKVCHIKSGNSTLIKGRMFSEPTPDLVPAFSASGQDIWCEYAEHHGPGIVVSAVGARCGKAFLADGSWTAIANTQVARPMSGINVKFLWYLLNDENFWVKGGSAQPFVKVKPSLELAVLLPPIAEQERIVDDIEEHFSRINAAESAAQTALAKLDTLRRTVLTAAFSGRLVNQDPGDEPASISLKRIATERPQRRNPDSSISEWTVCELAHLLDHTIGGIWGSKPGTDEMDVDVIRVTELIPDGGLNTQTAARRSITSKQYSSRLLKKGDILLEKSGGGPTTPVGRVAFFNYHSRPAICTNFMQLMRPNSTIIHSKFLFWQLHYWHVQGKTARLQKGSSNIRNLQAKQYLSETISYPDLATQDQIVTYIEEHFSRIDAAKASLERCLQRCNILRRAVLSAAFSGRLVAQDPNDEPASVLLERIAAEQPKRRTRRKSA